MTKRRSGILRSSRPKHPERPPKWHCSSAPRLHIALGPAAYIVLQSYRRNRPAPHLCPNLRRQTTSTFVCRHYLAPKRMLTSSLTARAKAAFFESCVYLSVVTVTPEGGAANRFQDFVPFKSSCYFLSGGPLLEEHEKCGTPFIFAANGSRLRVYSPEKCATRHEPHLRGAARPPQQLKKNTHPALKPSPEYPKGGSQNDQKCDGKNDPLGLVFWDDIPIPVTPHECVTPMLTFALLPASRPCRSRQANAAEPAASIR